MKHTKHLSYWLLLLMSLSAVIYSCKKAVDDPTPTPKPVPTVTSIDPATAPVGSTIAVNGTNLGTDPASTTITIGGVVATVVSATDTRIVVVVPAGVANGPVAVTTGGQTVRSPGSFTVYVAPVVPAKPIAMKKGTIFKNQTWSSDSIYLLQGMVYVPENYTLTIAPGTVIKGAGPESDPDGANRAGALIIERRAQLIARGTPTQPIVFTSAKPVGQRNYGDWGGIVLEGRSPINRPRDTPYPNGVRGNIEAYGEPYDNAGTLQYVRIEYAGAVQTTSPVARLAGLTMVGVGINTVIDHVQVSYSGGDAFSWFGGSVNAKNLVAYRCVNDDWTADWGYTGNVQFGVSLRDPAVADLSGSNGFEVENYEAGTADVTPVVSINGLPQTAPIFANISNFVFTTTPTVSAAGIEGYRSGIYLRRNSAISIYNSLFYGYPEGLHVESVGSTTGLTGGTIDLRGIVLANIVTPIVGGGVITNDQVTTYFTGAGRTNQVIASTDLASLLLNSSNFSLTTPNFLPQAGSPLLTGAVTGGKLANSFFTPVTYRGAFGSDNWIAGWTNFSSQTTEYTR